MRTIIPGMNMCYMIVPSPNYYFDKCGQSFFVMSLAGWECRPLLFLGRPWRDKQQDVDIFRK